MRHVDPPSGLKPCTNAPSGFTAPLDGAPPSNHAFTPSHSAALVYEVRRCSTTVLPSAPTGNEVGATRAKVSPLALVASAAGTCCVSIWNALFGSDGRESRSSPACFASTTAACDQKYGVKKHTGPLKLAVLRNSVQQLSPVAMSLPAVVVFGAVKGRGR